MFAHAGGGDVMLPMPQPPGWTVTRDTMQRIATHVLARRRHRLDGKFGLRATPGGIGTPAAGDEHETLRISGTTLIRERTGEFARTTTLDLTTATLADAAALAELDLTAPFTVGADTPPLGDPAAPLVIDPAAGDVLMRWFQLGWLVLDGVVTALGEQAEPTVVQLWPEHFDVGCDVAAAPGLRVNLGASPGDAFSEQPYFYVGPWTSERPGDAAFWNAPFGAVLGYDQLVDCVDPVRRARDFLLTGVALLRDHARQGGGAVGVS